MYSAKGGIGLSLYYTNNALLLNNCITIGNNAMFDASTGINLYYPSKIKLYNNTINYQDGIGTSASGISFYMAPTSDLIILKNNIVSCSKPTPALNISGDSEGMKKIRGNFNNLYSNGGIDISHTCLDCNPADNFTNSIFANPILTDEEKPVPLSCSLNINGEMIADTNNVDINDLPRTHIGAVEFVDNPPFSGGTYTIGTKGYFKTIKEAFSRLSSCGITGPIVLSLTDNVYNEESMLIERIEGLSATNTITLQPAPNVVSTVNFVVSESNDRCLRLTDIQYLTIDGGTDGPNSHNLRFVANNVMEAYVSATIIDLLANYRPVSNVTIRNCEFVGTNNLINPNGIINFSSESFSANNIIIENNIIKKGAVGIYMYSSEASIYNVIIRNNQIGDTFNSYNMLRAGLYLFGIKNLEVEKNRIRGVYGAEQSEGIHIENTVTSKVTNNIISEIFGYYGENSTGTGIINTLGVKAANILVANNVIAHIGGNYGASGLVIDIGDVAEFLETGGVKVYNNTINMYNDYDYALNNQYAVAYGIRLINPNNYAQKVSLLNNIISVKVGRKVSSGTTSIGLSISDKEMFTESDYNLIEVAGSEYNYTVEAIYGDILASMGTWRTYSGFDVNSITEEPKFVDISSWIPAYNSPCINTGKPAFTGLSASGTTTDVRGRDRIINGRIDIGAVEFEALKITSQSTNQTVCQGTNATLVVTTNYPEIASYRWQVSSNNVTWADSSAATNDTLVVNSQNYYRCIVSAPGHANDTSNAILVNVNPLPMITLVSPDAICMGQNAIIKANTSAGIVSWYGSATGGTVLAQNNIFTTPILTATTTYYAEASYNGCNSTSRVAATVTVNSFPAVEFKAVATNVTNENNGTIKIATIKGTAPFSYSIDGGVSYSSTSLFSDLAANTYLVTVKDNNSCVTKQSVIIGKCIADFIYTVTDSTLKLNNLSLGASQFYWTYGDGSVSNDSSPSYKYAAPGEYEVCMTMVNMTTNCMANKCALIKIDSLNTSYLAAKYTYTINQLQVSFANISEKATNYYWIFGDGQFSTEISPVHNYSRAGIYVVYLKAYNSSTGKSATYVKKIVVGTAVCSNEASFKYVVDNAGKVTFTNTSIGKNAYYWTFDDGMSSTLANPVHTYKNAGYYLVSLMIKDSVGTCSDAYSQLVKIGNIACKADFDYSVETSTNTVTLKNLSTGNIANNFWLFDGRNYSTMQNPTFKYVSAGIHNISLTVLDKNGSCIDYIEKSVQVGKASCNANFAYYVDSVNNKVEFTSLDKTGGTDAYWIFGDGTISTETNPVHIFKRAGYYQVSLTTFNPETGCMDNVSKIILVSGPENDCEADFIYLMGTDNQTVAFKNKSKGNIVKWLWNFGDNSAISNETSPTHLYKVQDDYNVCLTVVNTQNIVNITCKEIKVGSSVGNENKADFIYQVSKDSAYTRFYNLSSGTYNKLEWNFGDGKTSALASPAHKYSTPGYYMVSLKVTNTATNSHNVTYKLLNINKPDTFLVRFAFWAKPYSKKAGGYPIDFIGAGLGDQAKLKWDFGDGETDSTTTSPQHTYQNSDEYEVCLTYADPITGDSSKHCEKVTTATLCQSDEVSPEPLCKNIEVHLDANGKAVITPDLVDNGSTDACGIKSKSLSVSTFTTTGTKDVVLTVTDNSGNYSTCQAKVTVLGYVGVETTENQLGLNVYPNPFTAKLIIKMDIPDNGVVNLSIVDISGRNVRLTKQMTLEKGERFITLDGDMLEQGTYYLRVTDSKGRMKQTVIVKQ
ncbi:MAG TPA: PKD domain-containing protein [Bacteroidales bacterium]